jgi:hypothetical protein
MARVESVLQLRYGIARCARDEDLEPVVSIAPFAASQHPWRATRIFSDKELRREEAPLGEMGLAAFACF